MSLHFVLISEYIVLGDSGGNVSLQIHILNTRFGKRFYILLAIL